MSGMRYSLIVFTLFALMTGSAFGADHGTYRPGLPYSSINAKTADICEQQCHGDAQCKGWNFITLSQGKAATGICEFNAQFAEAVPSPGSISGENVTAIQSSRIHTGKTRTTRIGQSFDSAHNSPSKLEGSIPSTAPQPQTFPNSAAQTHPHTNASIPPQPVTRPALQPLRMAPLQHALDIQRQVQPQLSYQPQPPYQPPHHTQLSTVAPGHLAPLLDIQRAAPPVNPTLPRLQHHFQTQPHSQHQNTPSLAGLPAVPRQPQHFQNPHPQRPHAQPIPLHTRPLQQPIPQTQYAQQYPPQTPIQPRIQAPPTIPIQPPTRTVQPPVMEKRSVFSEQPTTPKRKLSPITRGLFGSLHDDASGPRPLPSHQSKPPAPPLATARSVPTRPIETHQLAGPHLYDK